MTGATGFVGRSVCAALLAEGWLVRAAVRRQVPGFCPAAQQFIVGDVGPRTDWAAALTGVDAVVHLAARVHVVRDTDEDPLAAYRGVNVEGTRYLALAAARANVRRIVYVSTVKVNGELTTERAFSADDPPHPEGPYATSKWEAETLLREAASSAGVEVVILRPPLVYGPGVGANFKSMMSYVRRGLPLPFGAVENRRSLVFVENLADLICLCAVHPHASGEVFLVSDGEDLSTPALLRHLAAAMGVRSRLVAVPTTWLRVSMRLIGRSDLFDRLCGSLQVDTSKTVGVLGWKPAWTIDRALVKTAQAFLAQ